MLRLAIALVAQQISAAAFAIMLLALMVATHLTWPEDAWVYRYDALLAASLLIQAALLALGWETWEEARVIAVFHVVGMVMEIYKTAIGSWVYPEPAIFELGDVPLFTGFMYSAVGSYIARSWRTLSLRFTAYPPLWTTGLLAAAIYGNFFTNAFLWDARALIFAVAIALFAQTRITAQLAGQSATVRLLPIFLAVGVLIWTAENIATWANVWLYPIQEGGWRPVPLQKIGSWTLLMFLSFALVSLLHRPDGAAPAPARG